MWLLAASLTGGANLGDFIKNYMHCKHCGNKMNEGARFCTSCGKESAATTQGENTVAAASSSEAEAIIKCGNCGFIGSPDRRLPARPGRKHGRAPPADLEPAEHHR